MRARRWASIAFWLGASLSLVVACEQKKHSEEVGPSSGMKSQAPVLGKSVSAPLSDPLLAEVDNEQVRLSMVEDRLKGVSSDLKGPKRVAEALRRAVVDALVLREMAVIDQRPKPGERPWQTVDRLLAEVYRVDAACRSIGEGDLKLAFMSSLVRYKHPSSYTIWEAQFVCCSSPDDCPTERLLACKRRLHSRAEVLAREIRQALPKTTGLPAGVSQIAMQDSPLPSTHGEVFEEAVAALAAEVSETRLRRYRFYARGEPGFEKAKVRGTSSAVEAAARQMALGEVAGPLETPWGWSVFLLVARQPALRRSFGDPGVRGELRARLCQARALAERQAYGQRLLRGARLLWRRPAILRSLGAEVWAALPPDAGAREPPHLPSM